MTKPPKKATSVPTVVEEEKEEPESSGSEEDDDDEAIQWGRQADAKMICQKCSHWAVRVDTREEVLERQIANNLYHTMKQPPVSWRPFPPSHSHDSVSADIYKYKSGLFAGVKKDQEHREHRLRAVWNTFAEALGYFKNMMWKVSNQPDVQKRTLQNKVEGFKQTWFLQEAVPALRLLVGATFVNAKLAMVGIPKEDDAEWRPPVFYSEFVTACYEAGKGHGIPLSVAEGLLLCDLTPAERIGRRAQAEAMLLVAFERLDVYQAVRWSMAMETLIKHSPVGALDAVKVSDYPQLQKTPLPADAIEEAKKGLYAMSGDSVLEKAKHEWYEFDVGYEPSSGEKLPVVALGTKPRGEKGGSGEEKKRSTKETEKEKEETSGGVKKKRKKKVIAEDDECGEGKGGEEKEEKDDVETISPKKRKQGGSKAAKKEEEDGGSDEEEDSDDLGQLITKRDAKKEEFDEAKEKKKSAVKQLRRHQKTTVPKGAGATAYKKKTQQLTDLVTSTTADHDRIKTQYYRARTSVTKAEEQAKPAGKDTSEKPTGKEPKKEEKKKKKVKPESETAAETADVVVTGTGTASPAAAATTTKKGAKRKVAAVAAKPAAVAEKSSEEVGEEEGSAKKQKSTPAAAAAATAAADAVPPSSDVSRVHKSVEQVWSAMKASSASQVCPIGCQHCRIDTVVVDFPLDTITKLADNLAMNLMVQLLRLADARDAMSICNVHSALGSIIANSSRDVMAAVATGVPLFRSASNEELLAAVGGDSGVAQLFASRVTTSGSGAASRPLAASWIKLCVDLQARAAKFSRQSEERNSVSVSSSETNPSCSGGGNVIEARDGKGLLSPRLPSSTVRSPAPALFTANPFPRLPSSSSLSLPSLFSAHNAQPLEEVNTTRVFDKLSTNDKLLYCMEHWARSDAKRATASRDEILSQRQRFMDQGPALSCPTLTFQPDLLKSTILQGITADTQPPAVVAPTPSPPSASSPETVSLQK